MSLTLDQKKARSALFGAPITPLRVAKPGFPLDLADTVQMGLMVKLATSSISHDTAADA